MNNSFAYFFKEKKCEKTNKKMKKRNFSFYLLLEMTILTPWHLKKKSCKSVKIKLPNLLKWVYSSYSEFWGIKKKIIIIYTKTTNWVILIPKEISAAKDKLLAQHVI